MKSVCAITAVVFALASSASAQEPVAFKADYKIQQGTNLGWIMLNCQIDEGNYLYDVQQQEPVPASEIKVDKSKQFTLLRGFQPNKKPIVVANDPIYEAPLNKHEGKVIFLAPIRVAEGVDPSTLDVQLKFDGQVCSDSGCFPFFDKPVSVAFGGYYEPKAKNQKKR